MMSPQQLTDGGIIVMAVLAVAVFGVVESAVKRWLHRRSLSRETKRYMERIRKGIDYDDHSASAHEDAS